MVRKRGKRGLSDVVTTLIIILLAIVAIGIIWVVVKNVIQSGSKQIELSQKCINVDFTSVAVLPVANQLGNYSVTLSRSAGGDPIAGVKLTLFNTTDNSGTLEFGIGLNPLETKTKKVSAHLSAANKFEVTPYFADASGNVQLCSQTRSFSLGASGAVAVDEGTGGTGEGDAGTGFCGDSIVQNPNSEAVAEVCDTGNLNGQSCAGLGLGTGTLSCIAANSPNECTFEVSGCSGAPAPSCDGNWDAQDVTDGNQCDGTPTPHGCMLASCACDSGFSPNGAGGCLVDAPLDTGTINSVWNNIYIDSYNLPKNAGVSSYTGKFINFSAPSLETGCFLITFADYLPDNDISYLRLDDSLGNPNVDADNPYSIYEAENCGA